MEGLILVLIDLTQVYRYILYYFHWYTIMLKHGIHCFTHSKFSTQVYCRNTSGRMQWQWIKSLGDFDVRPSWKIFLPFMNWFQNLLKLWGKYTTKLFQNVTFAATIWAWFLNGAGWKRSAWRLRTCAQKRRYFFCTVSKPSISGLKRINSNAFRLNFFVLFEIK